MVYDDSGRILRSEQSTNQQLRIQRLPTCTHLLVGVRARVDNIKGPESELKEFVINELQIVVEDLMVENVGDNYQKVTWKPTSAGSYACPRYYRVTQTRVESNDQPTVVKLQAAEKTELIFSTHPGCNTYTYEVVPIEESSGETRGTPANLTRKSQPPKLHAPTGVAVEQQYGGVVKISWKRVSHERSCGEFEYAVYANKTMGTDYTRVPAAATQTEKIVKLEQCTEYIVYVESIRTMDNITERVQSDAVRLRTKVEKPAPVASLAVTESKATSQKLTWDAPTNQLKCAWYELVKEKASNPGHPVVVHLDLVDTSYEFQQLTPGTTYKYKIRVVADGVAGDYSAEVVQATHTSAEDVIVDEGDSPLMVISSVDLRTVSLKLELSTINMVTAVHAVTLVVQPLLGSSQKPSHAYNNTAFPNSLHEAWNRKISSGMGPWEVLVWQQRIQPGVNNSNIPEKHTFTDILFQLGQYGVGCDTSLPCTNIPLLPGTRYSVQLKVYAGENIVESPPHLVTTRTDLSALSSLMAYIVLISFLGIGLLVAENAGFHIFPFSGPPEVELEKYKHASNFEMSAGQSTYDRPTATEAIAQEETEQFAAIPGAKQSAAPKTTSIGIDELSAYLQECLQPHNSFLVDQFNSLRKTDVDTGAQHALSTSLAMQPENVELNRSMDALPYDQNLVLVQGDASSLEEGRYINASYIFDIAPPSEPSEPPAVDLNCTPYIATQAPSPGTAGDFWQMVFEQKVNSIVQLAPSLGEFIPDFDAYWPTTFDDAKTYTSGTVELQIYLLSESAHSGYMRRKLSVTSSVDPDNPHEVTQFQLLNWPEQGVPDSQEFRFMLTAYRVFKFTETTLNSPTVVHCNNGIGRTGTFIAADIIKNHLEEGAEFIDIAGVVEQLRECRMNMVQKNLCVQPRQVGPVTPTACSPRQNVVTVQRKPLGLVLFVAALLISLQYEPHGLEAWSIYAYRNTISINEYLGHFNSLYLCQTNKYLNNNGQFRMKGSCAGHLTD
ncbi:protein-tyrosine phosphatase [Clonorchis sinensis]|uniref:Protein-tyrosine phosphatase n=1 Tax=Clonorchis sinensis TaxID=79923 RepID=G7YQW1_CLOSI|nr:protein-tyrosine phosphatase [Clonorchis sinensis]